MTTLSPSRAVTQFDSASSMLYALAECLHGRPFAGKGMTDHLPPATGSVLNMLPPRLRQWLYQWGGWWAAMKPEELSRIDGEAISRWVIEQYSSRAYPAVMIGSANGAMTHLAAALGVPWLPQTVLMTVRRMMDADELAADAEWGRQHIRPWLDTNLQWRANQMHDPLQDRLMVSKLAYFRMKRIGLGQAYTDFLTRCVPAGGTLITVECRLSWPAAAVGERHTFQVGGLGALTGEEYLAGGSTVEQFLATHHSRRHRWEAPGPTTPMPEAEWGFSPELLDDLRRLAHERGWRLRRLIFTNPQDSSPLIAELYRWWYRARGIDAQRLLVECFALLEPWWAMRTRSVPFWMAFNGEHSAEPLERYVRGAQPFDEILLMLLSNGVESIDFAPRQRWEQILRLAKRRGVFAGVNPDQFPHDMRSFFKYYDDLDRLVEQRWDPPAALTLQEFDRFMAAQPGSPGVEWRDDREAGRPASA